MNELSIFNYGQNEVRTVQVDGEPWFVAKDVASILGYSNPQKAVRDHCKRAQPVGVNDSFTLDHQTVIIPEPDIYRLVLRSKLPEAERFEEWVVGEVIPTIRKTNGVYLSQQKAEEILQDPDLIIGLAQQVKELRAKTEHQQKQIEADRPKTIFADAVSVAQTTILIGDFAKIIKQNGIEIGQKRLFERMRNEGFLIKNGSSKNMPTQRSMDLGLMQVKESTVNNPDGSVRITKTTKITGKGQLYFVNKFIEERDRKQAA